MFFVQESTHHLIGTVRNKQRKNGSISSGRILNRHWYQPLKLLVRVYLHLHLLLLHTDNSLEAGTTKMFSATSKDTHDINTWRNKTNVNETNYDQHLFKTYWIVNPVYRFLGRNKTPKISWCAHMLQNLGDNWFTSICYFISPTKSETAMKRKESFSW